MVSQSKKMKSKLTPKKFAKYFTRDVKEARCFESIGCVDFSNLYQAGRWLSTKDYSYGSMSLQMPIAIMSGKYELHEKWYNLTEEQKMNVDGVILSDDFRNGIVKIIIFK